MDNNSNKRIARNTIWLYMRMLFIMGVTLYTSRVVLRTLGVVDYGIYNVVGGIVMMFNFLNNAMISASQRFISYEQGISDIKRQKIVFSTSLLIHCIIGIIVILLGLTIGYWFVNNKMNIPDLRLYAANWVLVCAILSFCCSVLTVPFTASVIAHEKMGIYAYVSIIDALLKLFILYLLLVLPGDKLILYAFLLLGIQIINWALYAIYTYRNFNECRLVKPSDSCLIKKMVSFAGWSFLGNLGFSAKDYGVNIVVNLFCGPAVNAARGISYQVTAAIHGFVSSFQTAVNPQIVKRYAAGETNEMIKLVRIGSRFSFFLLSLFIVPVFVKSRFILNIWLGIVPEYTVQFLKLSLLMAVVNSMFGPLVTAIQATGRIKLFQIVIAIIMFLDLPLSYLILKMNYLPYNVVYIAILTAFLGLLARLIILNRYIKVDVRDFFVNIIIKNIVLFVIMSFPVSYLSNYINDSILGLLLVIIISFFWCLLVIYYLGINLKERRLIINKISSLLISKIYAK